VFEGHKAPVDGAQVIRDGRILSWSLDGNICVWSGVSIAPLVVLEGYSERIKGAKILSDGRILSWSKDETLRLWDGNSGGQQYVWSVPYDWERGPDVTGTEGSVRSQMRQHRLEDGEVRDVSGTQVVLTCGRHVRICQWVQASNIGEQNLM
jgi:WD40 repeat protein